MGVDKRYSEGLESKLLETYKGTSIELNYENYHRVNDDNYLDIVFTAMKSSADIILLDYSFQPENVLKAISLLRQMKPHTSLITLYDHQNTTMHKECCLSYSVQLNHLKSGEDNLNVMYSLCYMIFKDRLVEPKITQYKIRESEMAKILEKSKIEYISGEEIKIDSNHPLPKDEVVELKTNIDENVIPSTKFTVKDAGGDGAHRGEKKHWAILEYQYLDPIPVPARATALDKANIQEENEKREKEISETIKPAVAQWYETEVIPKNNPPKPCTFVIDPNLEILDDDSNEVGEAIHSLKFRKDLHDIERELFHYRPALIGFQYIRKPKEEEVEEGEEAVFNDMDSLKKLVKSIKAVKNFNTYLVIFNYGEMDNAALRETLDFPNLISTPEFISYESMSKFMSLLEQMNNKEDEGDVPKAVHLSLMDELANVDITYKIEIISMNEVCFEFKSKQFFQLFQTYYLADPIGSYFTIFPHKTNAPEANNTSVYFAIFHSYDSEQKKGIRQYVISGK